MATPISKICASVNYETHPTIFALAQVLATGEHVTSPVCCAGLVDGVYESMGSNSDSYETHESAIDCALAVLHHWLV